MELKQKWGECLKLRKGRIQTERQEGHGISESPGEAQCGPHHARVGGGTQRRAGKAGAREESVCVLSELGSLEGLCAWHWGQAPFGHCGRNCFLILLKDTLWLQFLQRHRCAGYGSTLGCQPCFTCFCHSAWASVFCATDGRRDQDAPFRTLGLGLNPQPRLWGTEHQLPRPHPSPVLENKPKLQWEVRASKFSPRHKHMGAVLIFAKSQIIEITNENRAWLM